MFVASCPKPCPQQIILELGLPYPEKMAIVQVLIFSLYFFIFSTVGSKKTCSNSFCGNNYFPITYPFKLQGQNPKDCNDYTDVRCNSQDNKTILNLPFSGDFYVQDIDYYTQKISLCDPGDCLVKRLINLNLSSSPFEAIIYEDYKFYNCPITNILYYRFKPIGCLSNSPNATVATAIVTPEKMKLYYNCSSIFSLEIPVSWYGEYENTGILNNFKLTWNVPHCKDCDEYGPQETGNFRSYFSTFFRHLNRALVIFLLLLVIKRTSLLLIKKVENNYNKKNKTCRKI